MNTHKPSEQGQIVILLMLVMVVLLAFTALAIDGGMVFSDRRHAQSVADSASLAGAGAAVGVFSQKDSDGNYIYINKEICVDEVINPAYADAIERASLNNISISQAGSLDGLTHGVFIDCHESERYLDIIVKMEGHTDTAFAHFIFGSQLDYTVESVTRVYPATALGFGSAIVSLSNQCSPPTGSGGITFSLSNQPQTTVPNINIKNGGIHSNSCLVKNGTVGRIEVNNGAGPFTYITTTNGDFTYPAVNPPPTRTGTGVNWDWTRMKTELDQRCAAYTTTRSHHGDGEIGPGKYSSIRLNSTQHHLLMQPGLYCVTGDFTINGAYLRSVPLITGDDYPRSGEITYSGPYEGVTIYLMPGSGVSIGGGVDVRLVAPPNDGRRHPSAMAGVLFFMDPGYAGSIDLGGNSKSIYEGGIYAPRGLVDIGGTNDIAPPEYRTQIVAYDIRIRGDATINITYDANQTPQLPGYFSVLK